MRELVFTLDYEPGCNAVADTLAEDDVRTFLDALGDAVGDCAEMEFKRVTEASSPAADTGGDTNGLPREQEEALRVAVEHGYNETPRDVDVGDLADHLDVPRSTLTYRLRRAEAYLATQRVARTPSPDKTSTPL